VRSSLTTESSTSSDEPISPHQQQQPAVTTSHFRSASSASGHQGHHQLTTATTTTTTSSTVTSPVDDGIMSDDLALASLIREVQGLRHLPKERLSLGSLGALRVATEYRKRFGNGVGGGGTKKAEPAHPPSR
jgi:hypothetical protein